jgi:hypothetical protein
MGMPDGKYFCTHTNNYFTVEMMSKVRRSFEGQSRSRLNFDPLARKKFDQLALNENGFGTQSSTARHYDVESSRPSRISDQAA